MAKKNSSNKGWSKTRYSFVRNLVYQVLMLIFTLIQTLVSAVCIVLAVSSFGGGDIAEGVAAVIIGVLLCAAAATPVIFLKEVGVPEYQLPATYYIDWENASFDALESAYDVICRNYPGHGLKRIYNNRNQSTRISYLEWINSVNWEENPAVKSEILKILAGWRVTVPSGVNVAKRVWGIIGWTLLSPLAFLFQVISFVLFVIAPTSRTLYITTAGTPFSMLQLPKKQQVFRFLFNAVSLLKYQPAYWLGHFDERR